MKVVKYILSIFFIIGSLGFIFKGDLLAGLFTLFLGAILLPPISYNIKKHMVLFQNRIIRYGIYIGLFLIGGAFVSENDTNVITSKEDVHKVEPTINEVEIKKEKEQTTKREKLSDQNREFNKIMGNDDFWNKYDPLVKRRIYKLIVEKNCQGLQKEYNVGANLMEKKQNSGKSASKELELISFLDDKMREIDCY